MIIENLVYPSHPVRFVITGPRECEESGFLTKLILIIISEYGKIYIYSTMVASIFVSKNN